MSDLSTALSDALSTVSTFGGESLTYRTTHAGSTTALTGWVLHRDRVQQPQFVSDRDVEAIVMEGTLKGPLTPALAVGYEIVDGNSVAWSITSVMSSQQQICRVKRSSTTAFAPDRGKTR